MSRTAHGFDLTMLLRRGVRSALMIAALGFVASLGASVPALASQCSQLASGLSLQLENGATVVGPVTVQDITSGSYTPAGSASPITGLPPFCRVALDISSTGDASQSQILVEVWMPDSGWNGRYLGTGNGGFAGAISTAALAGGLLEGYAVANTDLGTGVLYHCNSLYCGGRTGLGGPPAGLNGHPDSIKDFGYRATHLMTVAAKQVVSAFYGSPAPHSYFAGCSTGGQQSLMEAQRFPEDYNGILAGAPAYDRTHLHMSGSWPYAWTHASSSSLLTVPALSLINNSVLAKCGGHDGGLAGEGFLTQPAACRFDARALQCSGAETDVPCTDPNATSCTCLAPEQASAMDAIWHGPVDDRDRRLQPGFLRSSETPVPLTAANPVGNLGLVWAEAGNEPPFDGLIFWALGPDWKWQDFFADATDPVAMLSSEISAIDNSRVGDMSFAQALNATSADLGAFRDNGSKLILYQGWSDPLIPGYVAVDYWRALRRGDASKLADYARLFMAPGMWHCSGGPGPNAFGGQDQVASPKPGDPTDDALAALTNWVEKDVAPTQILATKYVNDVPAQGIALQRPICQYPRHAAYRGSGDSKDPASFECVRDEGDRILAPAPIYGP
ncbi:tannase/feruloyl esterase family alpha/beta hydrolase [Rhodopila sp.]|uniref:tannase/feruloyl esterase family alpha/beta hydrolase n=1 Tax=Rhodopila sp. TaxID=2480087 RepID=UPI003D149FFF